MRWLISIPLLGLLCGCADIGYYWNSATGHLAVMQQRVYIDDLLADKTLEADLRERLLLVKEIRRFAIERLKLPANGSYRSYVDLQRPWVVQNLFAAEEFSTRLRNGAIPSSAAPATAVITMKHACSFMPGNCVHRGSKYMSVGFPPTPRWAGSTTRC